MLEHQPLPLQRPVKEQQPWPDGVKVKLVSVISFIQFLCNCMFTQLSPFYPIKAKERGLDVVFVGYVIEAMAITQLLSSLVQSKLMNKVKIERYNMMLVGLLLLLVG